MSDESAKLKPARGAYYTLGVLFLVLAFSVTDRYLLSILLVPIQDEMQVSDTAMGFLTGLAFAVFHSLAGIPLARIADRSSRRNLIAISIAAWSLLTALQGLARSFTTLALARVGVGIGEAGASRVVSSSNFCRKPWPAPAGLPMATHSPPSLARARPRASPRVPRVSTTKGRAGLLTSTTASPRDWADRITTSPKGSSDQTGPGTSTRPRRSARSGMRMSKISRPLLESDAT